MPKSLLDLPQLQFIHFHPGYLPNIRGADCTLWSMLLYGRPSASCFYMDAGIDTGDVIFPCWLPELKRLPFLQKRTVIESYRMIFGFIDPWVRAYALRIFCTHYQNDPDKIKSISQQEKNGLTFHFMHEKLKQATFDLK